GIDTAVHHFLDIGNLELGAMVVDHGVGLEDVAPDLAAEAYIRLGRIERGLVRFATFDLRLIKFVLQHLHRLALVLELGALLLRSNNCPRWYVSDPNRGAGFVDVLAPGAGRAIDIDPEILFANLDVDFLVDDGINEDRRKARVTAGVVIERRDPHQAVHARLRPQESIRVLAADLEDGAFYSRLFPFALVKNAHLESAALRPARVHPHQHLRPVLGFSAAGAGADLDLCIAEVVLTAQQRFHLEQVEIAAQLLGLRIELALHLGFRALQQHLVELERADYPIIQFVVGVDPTAQAL